MSRIFLNPSKIEIRVKTDDTAESAEDLAAEFQEIAEDDTDDRYRFKVKIQDNEYYYFIFKSVVGEHGKRPVKMQDAFYLVELFQRKRIAHAGDVLDTIFSQKTKRKKIAGDLHSTYVSVKSEKITITLQED